MNLATASLCTMLTLLAHSFPQEAGDTHHSRTPSLPAAANGWQLDAAIGLVSPSAAINQDGPAQRPAVVADARPFEGTKGGQVLAEDRPETADRHGVTAEEWSAIRRLPVRTARRQRYVNDSSKVESSVARSGALSRSARSPSQRVQSPSVQFPSAGLSSEQLPSVQSPTSRTPTDTVLSVNNDTPGVDISDADATDGGPRQLSKREQERRDQVRQALRQYFPRQLNTKEHNCWEVMHSVIGYGTETLLRRGGPRGEAVNGIGYLCWNGPCLRDQLLYLDGGRVAGRKGPRVQGHHGQFLAILAQSHVTADYPLQVEGKSFTVADLIEFEQRGCRPRTELTFKLIALSHYLGTDAEWQSDDGEAWSIQRLIQEELAQPIRGVACGGTHRMMGFSYALRKREKEGGEITGQFERARQFVDEYHNYTFALQNRDGSFSTAWFERREDRPDLTRRLQTSGHILEWMVFSVPQETLSDERLVRAVDYLSGIMVNYPNHPWEIGHLGHALHALAIYDRRAFGSTILAPPYGIATTREKVGRSANAGDRRREPSTIKTQRPGGAQDDPSATRAAEISVRSETGVAGMPPAVAAAQRRLRSHQGARLPLIEAPSSTARVDDRADNEAWAYGEARTDDEARTERLHDSEYAPTGPSLFGAP